MNGRNAILQALVASRWLVHDQSRWCQFTDAMNRAGKAVVSNDPAAVKWCATGSVRSVCATVDPRRFHEVYAELDCASQELYGEDTIDVNDFRGHVEVLKVFDQAIERVGSER